MKINSINNQNCSFGSGVTPHIAKEINNCNTKEVAMKFAHEGIPADFNLNKVFAYCSSKSFDIIKFLNDKYNLKLQFPSGIYVDDFNKMNFLSSSHYGMTTVLDSMIYDDSLAVYPKHTIFFNDMFVKDAKNFDIKTDHMFDYGNQPSSFFLTPILHEFAHVIFNSHLLDKYSEEDYAKHVFNRNIPPRQVQKIKKNICAYAGTDVFEAVACDMSKRIVNSLDETTLLPKYNPFENSPYRKYGLFEFGKEPLDNLLHKFWKGKFH